MKGNRGERLSSQFREEIYGVISTDIRNKYPEMSAIVSVTDVDVAADLKSARVYISVFDTDKERKKLTYEIILKSAGYIRHTLSKLLHLRTVPELRFIEDDSLEYGEKIDKLLKKIETEEDTGGEE